MIKKLFLTYFVVQLATYVTTIIGMTVDGIVTGSLLGTDAMAAYGFVTPFLTVLAAIASAISVGTSTLVSAKLGKGDLKEMNKAFNICFFADLLVSLLFFVIIFVFAENIASALGAHGEIAGLTTDYLKGYSFAFPAIFLVVLSSPILQLNGKHSALIISIVSMTAVNIFMDFFNVYVWHKQMLGMALATTFSYYVALIIILFTMIFKAGIIRIKPELLKWSVILEMVSYGAPNAVSMTCRSIMMIAANALILRISNVGMVAGFAAIMSAMSLVLSIGISMASTVSILSGVFSGEKDKNDLVALLRISFKYSFIINGICSVIFVIFSNPIVSLFFRGDAQLFSHAVTGLRIIVVYSILFSINFCIRSYYQAMKIRIAIPYAVFNCLVFPAVLAYAMGYTPMGIIGLWIAYPLGEFVTLLFFGIYAMWKSDRRHKTLERFMLIPEEYYNGIEPLELTVSSMEGAVEASEKLRSYMRKENVSEKLAVFAALSVEELAGNIIRYGFGDNKTHHVMVKLKKDKECWILRIRDDCRNFDPVSYVEGITSDEKESHYGIRMIYALANDVQYLNTLNMNNLLIRFSTIS